MSIHSSMSATAIRRRIERDQTTHYLPTIAEIIAVRYDLALRMIKIPFYKEKGEIRAPELEAQLKLLADYAAESEECFADDPPTMRLYDANEKLLEELEGIATWLDTVTIEGRVLIDPLTPEQKDLDSWQAKVNETRKEDYPR